MGWGGGGFGRGMGKGVGFTWIDDSGPAEQAEVTTSLSLNQLDIHAPNQDHHSRSCFCFLWKRESVLVHLPESGKILSLSHIRITCVGHSLEKKRFSEMFFFFFLFLRLLSLLWRKGWGGKMPFVTTTFFIQWTPPPSVNTKKKKKRNRIMHVFLKFAFMITLNFVYYYLCIIEIECTLFFYESTSFHSDIYFMSCKIVPSALPHSENKWLEMKIFLL